MMTPPDRRQFLRQSFTLGAGLALAELFQNPGCLGFHLCGAYQRNKARRYGLLDEQERPDTENVALITVANQRITDSLAKEFPGK